MPSNKYQFNQVLERKGTNAMSVEGYRGYLFDPE